MRLLSLIGAFVFFGSCATGASAQGGGFQSRLSTLEAVVTAARAQPWGAELKQIPATVIDVGDLTAVPYVSFAGKDVELNVYGDPAHPAGVEIGTKSEAPEFRAAIRAFLAGLLAEGDRKRLDTLAEGKKEEADGLALEITLPTATDAYGAWWVTATHPVGLQGAKATVGELEELSHAPQVELVESPAFPDVGTHSNFFSYPRFRPVGKRVYVTSYYKENGVYRRRK